MKNIINNLAEKSRNDFPLFNGSNNNNLIYLDHAATSQKPQEVINSIKKYYNSIMVKSKLVIAGSNFIFNHINENYKKYLNYIFNF